MKKPRSIYAVIAIVLTCVITTAFTLSAYAVLIQHLLTIKYNSLFELCMVMGMLFFQYPFIYKKSWSVKLNYYFNMLLVSLMGAVMLWPLLIINRFYSCSDTTNLIYFFTVVLLMFFEHKRRVAQLSFPFLFRTPGFYIALLF